MNSFWTIVGLIVLVSTVYASAYRLGYRASQAKAEALVREMRAPVDELLAKLHREINMPPDDNRGPRNS
jgi:hypothetical protein